MVIIIILKLIRSGDLLKKEARHIIIVPIVKNNSDIKRTNNTPNLLIK